MNYLIKISFFSLMLIILFTTGCQQEENSLVDQTTVNNQDLTMSSDEQFLNKHNHFPWINLLELLHARIATARYRNINNAIADGYVDINVIMPNMGHHYMKAEYVDAEFEVDKPELLVYSPHPVTGNMRLVAVEYAIPNTEPEPEGFTGNHDVWSNNATFGLWLLHVWVWYYNPDGVFNPTNPLIP